MTPRERAEALAERCTWCGVSLCDHCQRDVERAIESALAEQAAGEAERTAQAVAREREACARECWDFSDELAGETGFESECGTLQACAARIRARATSPAPEPVADPLRQVEEWLATYEAETAMVPHGASFCGGPLHGASKFNVRRHAADVCRSALAAARKGGG